MGRHARIWKRREATAETYQEAFARAPKAIDESILASAAEALADPPPADEVRELIAALEDIVARRSSRHEQVAGAGCGRTVVRRAREELDGAAKILRDLRNLLAPQAAAGSGPPP